MIQTSSTTPMANSAPLRYANPRDLPSYPSSGLRPDGAAASAAASLGWSTQKSVDTWKPDRTSSASAAAVLAKDFKPAPSWQPADNSAGAKAALLAVEAAGFTTSKGQLSTSPQKDWGNSAANQAFNTSRLSAPRQVHQSTSTEALEGQRSLAAAKGAMTDARRRATSTPAPAIPSSKGNQPENVAASNALSGATLAHQASLKSKPAPDAAGAVSVTTMTRRMFTAQPPVKPEVDDRENKEKLHASAVEMAQKLYAQQQKIFDEAKSSRGHDEPTSEPQPQIGNLQDAAYKQAQDRLAKLHTEHQKQRELNSYYGSAAPVRHRFSISNKLRRRASSDGAVDDRHQSDKIRQQMSLFSDKLSQVDEKKRQEDRDALLAVAHRNVRARLDGMEKKHQDDTGHAHSSRFSEWDIRAQQVAAASHQARNEHKGKVEIGGGKFMERSEIDDIATRRMQPLIDDMNEKADAERERLAALKMDEEARKAELESQKARDREFKAMQKKIKEQERQEEKARKHEMQAAKAESKRLAKGEKRRSREEPAGSADLPDNTDDGIHDSDPIRDMSCQTTSGTVETNISSTGGEQRNAQDTAVSPTAKVKGWIKNRFSRGKSIDETTNPGDKGRSFLGGAALRGPALNDSTASLENLSSSMRDVALVGRVSERVSRGVSPISSQTNDNDDDDEDGENVLGISPPRPIEDTPNARSSSSPTRDSRFREEMDQ